LKKKSQKNPRKIFHLRREGYEDYYILNGKLLLFYSNSLVKIGDEYVPGELISDIWSDVLPNDLHNEGGVTLRKGKKPEKLIGRFIELTTSKGQTVLDFFVGSGTTCAAAQKMGRKWIGIDFGDFFDRITLTRLKNTLYGETSGISSQTNWSGGGFFKYQYIEQYEDTLNNIEFLQPNGSLQARLDKYPDYFISYMLDYETRESPARLSFDQFKKPFNYQIKTLNEGEEKAEPVDLVETFNYLLGLNVQKIRAYKDGDWLYRAVFGNQGNKQVAIIWRNIVDLDLRKDKEFIENTILADIHPDTIYLNGDSYVENATPIEPEFKRLMRA